MQCNNCGHELEPGVEFCGNCGAKLLNAVPDSQTAATTSSAPQTALPANSPVTSSEAQVPTPPSASTTTPSAAYAVARQPKNGMSIASLVLGILACVTFFIFFLSIPMGILAIIFGFIGRSKGSKGMGLAGIILGAIAVVLTIVVIGIAANYCNNNPQAEACADTDSSQAKFIRPLRLPNY